MKPILSSPCCLARRGLLILSLVGAMAASAATTTLVSTGAVWRYLADGSDQGTAWQPTSFDDSSWPSGAAKLGFGDTDVVTSIGAATDGFITFYFRRSFVNPGTNLFTQVQARLLRDDGAVVYFNGVELFRQNMPTGVVNHLTVALGAVGGTSETTYYPENVPAALALLQPGLNTVAVEVHQNTNTSSDIGFDFELIGISDATPPSVTLTNPPTSATFLAGDNIALNAVATDDSGVAQVEFYANGQLLGNDTTAPYAAALNNVRFGNYVLTAVAQDLAGLRATSAPVVIPVRFDTNIVTLLPNRTCWSYWDKGIDLGTDWVDPDFDDSAWPMGFAELGYGDGDETTLVGFGGNATNKYITTYFRRRFTVTDPIGFTNVVLRLKRDDGAVVYVNGTEVFRDNLPAGPIDYLTLAAQAGDDGASYVTTNVSPQFLVFQENTLAVEIHQSAITSSDISFDLQLIGQVGVATPTLRIARVGTSQVLLAWPAASGAGFTLQSTPALGTPWSAAGGVAMPVGAELQVVQTLTSTNRFYRLCAASLSAGICQPPVVVAQTESFAGQAGTNFLLEVTAIGEAPLSYHWRLNGDDILGATNSSYLVSGAQRSDGGVYDVLVGNRCGCTTCCPIPVTIAGSAVTNVTLADAFAMRASLANLASFQIISTNPAASVEAGEPGHPVHNFGHTVWLEWQAPMTGVIEVDSLGSGSPGALAVYIGNALSNLVLQASAGPVASGGASRVVLNVASNTAYQIQLDNAGPSPLRGLGLHYLSVMGPVPQFIVPPRRVIGTVGQTATLIAQVKLDGIVPDSLIQLQWRTDAGPIAGATNATLTIPNLQKTQALTYYLDAVFNGFTNTGGPATLIAVQTGVDSGSITEPTGGFVSSFWCGSTSWDRHRIYLFRLPPPVSAVTTTLPCSLAGNIDPYYQPALAGPVPMTISTTPTRLRLYTDTGANPPTLDTCILVVRQKKCNTTCGALQCYNDVSAPANLLSDGTFVFPSGCTAVNPVHFIKVGVMFKNPYSGSNVELKFDYLP